MKQRNGRGTCPNSIVEGRITADDIPVWGEASVDTRTRDTVV